MHLASALIASISFAASLATIAGVVIESAQTLTTLCSKLNHAPNDLKRFLPLLRQHEAILVDLRARFASFTADEFGNELQIMW